MSILKEAIIAMKVHKKFGVLMPPAPIDQEIDRLPLLTMTQTSLRISNLTNKKDSSHGPAVSDVM
jgi:hypothetical protein